MSASGERSAIGQAVELLKAALLKSDEAAGHGEEARRREQDAWALFRQAGLDSEAESMSRAIDGGRQAQERLVAVLTALATAQAAVRGYIAAIAPNQVVSDARNPAAPNARDPVDGADRQRRSLSRVARVLTERGEDAQEGIAFADKVLGNIQQALRPVDPAGLRPLTLQRSETPVVRPTTSPGASQDAAFSVTIIAILSVEATRRAVRRFRSQKG